MVREVVGVAASTGADLVARVRKFREVQSLEHETIPNVAEELERIRKFLQEHETPSASDNTHTVFDNYTDWWVGQKPSFKLAIAEDNTIELLNKYISELYLLGVPLTLAEKRTPEIKFVQDLCIWGTPDETIKAEELFGSAEKSFVTQLGRAIGEVYPQSEFLDVVIFDATGMSRTKGVMKTSIRLVWSGLVVDKDRALRIHDYVVHKFKDAPDDELKGISQRALEYNKDNVWGSIFSPEVYQSKHCVRMPLCDRVSPSPMKGPEHRPFAPIGVIRYGYQEGVLQKAERLVERDDLDGHEWIKIGSVRCDAGTPLTEWTQPQWKGERAARTVNTSSSMAAAVAAGGRSSGQVKVRTRNGSETGPTAPRGPRTGNPQTMREERIMTAEREFDGTVAEFRERLEQQLGPSCQEQQIQQDDRELTWKQAGDAGASLMFKASNKRVYITGKVHQVRSLLSVISSFARGVGEAARSVTHTARSQRGPQSTAGGYAPSHASLAPSAVYAPSMAGSFAPSQAYSNASRQSTANAAPREFQPSSRTATRSFKAEGASELNLTEGDHVTITHDPEEEQKGKSNNVHRWVYGSNDTTGERGWFPLSHAVEDAAAAGATATQES